MDMIVQNVGAEGQADISFSVYRPDLARTLKAVEEACKELGSGTYTCDDNVSKVSVVGLGHGHTDRGGRDVCSERWPRRESTC